MISAAYQKAQYDGISTVGFKASDLTPYMNYVTLDTSSNIDGGGNAAGGHFCSPTYPCLRLHNGGLLLLQDNCAFSSTTPQTFTQFWFDPDGEVLGPSGADGPSKSVMFDLYYDGFLTTRDQLKANSSASCGTYGPSSGLDSSWFSWN